MPEPRPGTRKTRATKPEPAAATMTLEAIGSVVASGKGRTAREPAPVIPMEEALREITTVAAASLHRHAAHTWAARAVACYRVCMAKADQQQGLSYLYLGEHYREAALAHASFGEAWRPLRNEVEALMDADRESASNLMRQRSLADPRVKA